MPRKCITMKTPSVKKILAGDMRHTRRFADYGQPGDELVVREAFAIHNGKVYFKADYDDPKATGLKFRSGRQMPQRYARIKLRITEHYQKHLMDASERELRIGAGSWEEHVEYQVRNFGQEAVDEDPIINVYNYEVVSIRKTRPKA